jgi:protein-tyrosine phosphatase
VADPANAEPVRVCFVCLGNICRSPTAEAVMVQLVADAGLTDRIEVDSAGTGAWHVGEPPDERATEERGAASGWSAPTSSTGATSPTSTTCWPSTTATSPSCDLAPRPRCGTGRTCCGRFDPVSVTRASSAADLEVPDPYYGGPDGFAHVFDLVDAACRGLLDHPVEHADVNDVRRLAVGRVCG